MAGLLSIAIGLLLIYIALSKKGGLVADFAVKLFQPTPTPTDKGDNQQ